jgi:hypothetical protein
MCGTVWEWPRSRTLLGRINGSLAILNCVCYLNSLVTSGRAQAAPHVISFTHQLYIMAWNLPGPWLRVLPSLPHLVLPLMVSCTFLCTLSHRLNLSMDALACLLHFLMSISAIFTSLLDTKVCGFYYNSYYKPQCDVMIASMIWALVTMVSMLYLASTSTLSYRELGSR